MKLILAFIAASIVPALLISGFYLYGQFSIFDSSDPYIWVRTRKFAVISLVISTGFVLALGAPTFFLMRWANAVKWWSALVAGFLLAAIPVAIFTWPVHPAGNYSASVNGVPTVIDGVPTLEGWLQYAYSSSSIGLLGAAGALAFWLVWRKSPNQQPKPTP